ncbi:MAG: pantetheine-phosphate adenylyltransferase [Thermosulfidibacteraceae bacterium]|jgi:pantetheine-phosphate adenylyltransferase
MKKAVYPGTFDPVTNGHIDIMKRASRIFDKVIVAIAKGEKKNPLFTLEERYEMLRIVVEEEGLKNVEVDTFDTLLVDYVVKVGANVIVRGLRAVSDFEYEFQMALMNRKLNQFVETIFLMPSEQLTYVSSRIVKEIAFFGGNVRCLVPSSVAERLKEKFSTLR